MNNAAFQMSHEGLADLPSDEIERTFRTNIFAMFYLSKAALPQMRPGGAIINTASIQAYQPIAERCSPMPTTKGAIVTFTKGLAQDAIERGMRVNAVAPGPVWTPLIPSTIPPEQAATVRAGLDLRAPRPARRTGAQLRLPRLRRVALHHRRSPRRHRRQADLVS